MNPLEGFFYGQIDKFLSFVRAGVLARFGLVSLTQNIPGHGTGALVANDSYSVPSV